MTTLGTAMSFGTPMQIVSSHPPAGIYACKPTRNTRGFLLHIDHFAYQMVTVSTTHSGTFDSAVAAHHNLFEQTHIRKSSQRIHIHHAFRSSERPLIVRATPL